MKQRVKWTVDELKNNQHPPQYICTQIPYGVFLGLRTLVEMTVPQPSIASMIDALVMAELRKREAQG